MLIYTFRTFPWIDNLPKDIFIFGKLNEDLERFKEIILREKPGLILGIAKADSTRVETKAINKFNKNKISKDGPESYDLYIPDFLKDDPKASKPTYTFCNWTMYKVASLIEQEKLQTNFSFIHISETEAKLFGKLTFS